MKEKKLIKVTGKAVDGQLKNADVIAAKATSAAAKSKAALASTDAYRIMHGEIGLAFKGNNINSVVLNQDKGLVVAGTTGTGSSKKNVFFKFCCFF